MKNVVTESIEDVVRDLGIDKIVHFTTNHGLLGIAAKGAVLARSELDRSEYLENVYKPMAKRRKDVKDLGYINLSLCRINASFFEIASKRWYKDHDDLYWCVLAFSPEILVHPGVKFSTTNNMYSGVVQGVGAPGLRALYSPLITQWSGQVVKRAADAPKSFPTCQQAEVLYPKSLSLDYLSCIYVYDEEFYDTVYGLWHCLPNLKQVPIIVDRDMFA